MANSLTLSDSNYWDSDNITIPFANGNNYSFTSLDYEVQAARGNITHTFNDNQTGYHDETVTFPTAFSRRPIVVLCNSRNSPNTNSGDQKDSDAHYGLYIIKDTVTTTGFKLRWMRNSGHLRAVNNSNYEYIAIVPKTTTETINKGTWKAVPEVDGVSIKMSDNNFWSLDSIIDSKNNNHNTLHSTYYTWDHGSFTVDVPKNDCVVKTFSFNKVFASGAIGIAGFDNTGTYKHSSDAGKTGLSICTVSGAWSGSNGHKEGRVIVYNGTGSRHTYGIHWIVVGKAEA